MSDSVNIAPAFDVPNSVNVVFAADANYAPYLAAALASLVAHSSDSRLYDVNVLSSGIGETDQAKITSVTGGQRNFSVRFLDTGTLVGEAASGLFVSGHLSSAAYYRLFAPSIFRDYGRIVYLDCDVTLLANMAELFDVDLGGKSIGAVRDYFALRDLAHANVPGWANQLALRDTDGYFNSGVLVMDLSAMRAMRCQDRCLQWLREVKTPFCHDQDVLNHVLEGDVAYLDPVWNATPCWAKALGSAIFESELLPNRYAEYLAAMESPKILHYAAPEKPWHLPHLPYADKFWQYAESTPFFKEIILYSLVELSHKVDRLNSTRRFSCLLSKVKYGYYVAMSRLCHGMAALSHRRAAQKIKSRYL